MLMASDITGLFLLPLGITMHNYAVDIMNETGIIFIPFTIVIVKEFIAAKSRGSDNGSSAVMFLRNLEVEFFKKLFVLLIFVMPITSTNGTYSFSQYSQSTKPSLLYGTESVSDLNPNTNFSDYFGKGQAPLGFGLFNNISVAMSNAILAKMPCTVASTTGVCTTDVSAGAIAETLKGILPVQEETNQAVNQFARSCYLPAITKYFEATESDPDEVNLLTESFPDNSAQKYMFSSSFMKSVYLGVYDIDGYNNQPQLWINETNAGWSNSSIGSGAKVKCQTAATSLYDLLYDNMVDLDNYSYLSTMMNAWVDYFQRYGGDENEIVATSSLARKEFVSAMFINSYNKTNHPVKEFLDKATDEVAEAANDYVETVKSRWLTLVHVLKLTFNSIFTDDLKGQHGKEYFKSLGLNALHLATSGAGAVEAYNTAQTVQRVTPTLFQLASVTILMLSPIVIVMSGYDFKVAYRLSIMYMALCFSPYVYELGQIIGNNLIAVAGDSDFTTQQFGNDSTATSTLQSMWIGYKMPLILVGLWNMAVLVLTQTQLPNIIAAAPKASVLTAKEVAILKEADGADIDIYKNAKEARAKASAEEGDD